MVLSVRPLEEALVHLETHVGLISSSLGRSDVNLAQVFRTASIKSFEYCYALAIKAIERALAERSAQPEAIEIANFRSLIRMAWEAGLVREQEAWLKFREMRNITAHTYDADRAAEVLKDAPDFIAAVRHLVLRLKAFANAM